MTKTYVALGSNLGEPHSRLHTAVEALQRLPDTEFERVSSIYCSAAIGPGSQPDYLNAVALLDTRLSPLSLLTMLQEIETQQGRTRDIRWGARTIDLDILLYGDAIISSPELTIPHPRMEQRHFVLYPLHEISGDDLLMPDGKRLNALLEKCSDSGLTRTPLLWSVQPATQ
jgi:2-amino-4-hydroxy-6-hydroxymethyldihydropteridine diphosphokinase